ncbi:unnamed protein product [Oppiella nova]|uniref:Putative zinc-finger domain-containing protein n=1 Tax=Oppiella nova TaxID=334625 RepID=A0A7R9QIN2_9ACAR|nr:unnamed protein product [Oppiella nova]CAG2165756.1 unnamed protein product [Oppiella nova]
MSLNADFDDLEEGEIEDNNTYDVRFGHNLAANETTVANDRHLKTYSPIFQSVLNESQNSLFGLSDIDLRFDRNSNSFNDCDDRLVGGNASMPPTNALLPTPLMPLRHLPSIHSFPPPIGPPIGPPIQRFDGLHYPHPTQQSLSPNQCPPQSVPFISDSIHASEPKSVTSFVIPNSDHSTIPFICDPNDTQMQTITSDERTEESTIVLETANDIEEVEMSDQSNPPDLSPYDPEEDISNLCPLSPNPLEKQSVKQMDNNVKSLKTSDKCLDFNPKSSKRSVSEEQTERLKRLLKSDTYFKSDKMDKRSDNRVNRGSKQSTAQRSNKSKESVSPVRKSSSKRVIHSKLCHKSGHKSRRKVKRNAKRQVITQYSDQRYSNVRPKSRNNMNESSYEDLLEEYERLKEQLKELEDYEKPDDKVMTVIDREEQENIEKLVKCDDMFGLDTEVKENREENDEEVEDDDELELRRLALASKKKKQIEEQENEELRLRQQLLQSLFRSKAKAEQEVNRKNNKDEEVNELIAENVMISSEHNSNTESIPETRIETQTLVNMSSETENMTKPTEQLPLKPIPKLIINFGDDSTDEELDVRDNTSNVPKGLDFFLRQARLRSEPNKKSVQSLPVLSITRQRELQELKAEILRREQNQINDKKLKENESLLKSSNERLVERISKRNLLKNRVILKRNALRKAQIQARKMQEAFIAATRVVSTTASEFHSFNDELKNIEKDVKQEVQNITNYKKECFRMGTKLKGNAYKLPTGASFKRSNSLSSSVSPNKKESKLEANSPSKEDMADHKKRLQQELMQKLENCSKLLNLKKANLLRPSSPNPFVLKAVQSPEPNNDKNESQKILQTLVKDLLKVYSIDSLMSYECFLENMFSYKCHNNFHVNIPEMDSQLSVDYKANSCDNSYDSVLSHLHSYRLIENQPKKISSDHWTNNLNPLQEICKFDLLGSCNDEKCLGQHIDKSLLNGTNKMVDLLLYEPKLAGITSEIPERIDGELFEAIKQKLHQFSQKLVDSNPKLSLETHCRRIAEQIRKLSKPSVVCLLTRRIPKVFNTSKIDIPFDDLKYRFNIKDKTLVINQTKISELKLSADPDIYIKNRFFAPEGVPISAQLETTLATDPHNIQLWIKLAYYHISRCSDNNSSDSIDSALNVLSRALENNSTEPELYEHYLFIYSNRVVRKGEDSKFNLKTICTKAVQHCPHYRIPVMTTRIRI